MAVSGMHMMHIGEQPGPAHYERASAIHGDRGHWRPLFTIHGRDLHECAPLPNLQLATGSRWWRLDSVSCVTTVSHFCQ
jgi:hypothetical protein